MLWLTAWRRKSIFFCILSAIGGLLFAVALLAMAWVIVFAVSVNVMISGGRIHAIIATAALPLLFVGSALISQDSLEKYSVTPRREEGSLTGRGLIALLSPRNIIAIIKITADVLFSGPRVAIWSAKQAFLAFAIVRIDVVGCAAVLDLIYRTGHRMSYQEISGAVAGLNPVKVFNQLRLLDGVLFLTSDPPGLALESELKEELALKNKGSDGLG